MVCVHAYVRACVHVCVCVLEAGWGLGGMELRIGSDMIFFFLCLIYCRFSYGTCTLFLYICIYASLVLIYYFPFYL